MSSANMSVENMATQRIDILNSFLRGELSAAETYRQAIDKLGKVEVVNTLSECLRSHERRVDLLTQRISELGGSPATGSGLWGAFSKLVQGGANLFGAKTAIASLEEGEDHGRDDYIRDLDKLDLESRRFIESRVFPEQLQTHETLRSLKAGIA